MLRVVEFPFIDNLIFNGCFILLFCLQGSCALTFITIILRFYLEVENNLP